MSTQLQIEWELPEDLALVESIVLYRIEDPSQNKTCDDLLAQGELLLRDSTNPYTNSYVDELDIPGFYRYGAFTEGINGDISECTTFVYEYDNTVEVTIIIDKSHGSVSGFGTEVEDGNDLVYTGKVVKGSSLNLADIIVPNLSKGYSVKEVLVFPKKSPSETISGTPTLTFNKETQINVILSRATRKLTIKGDPDYFKQVGKAKGTVDTIKISTGRPPNPKKILKIQFTQSKRSCYDFDRFTPEGPDPYGQAEYDPTNVDSKIILDQDYVLRASYKEKKVYLLVESSDDEIGSVSSVSSANQQSDSSGLLELTCFDTANIIATPTKEKVKFKEWLIRKGGPFGSKMSRIVEGDPTTVPEGLVSQDPIEFGPMKINGGFTGRATINNPVELVAKFTKVFELLLKIMGPNGIEGTALRGSISTTAPDHSISGNTITAFVEELDGPFEILAEANNGHKFYGWELINGSVDGIAGANSTIELFSDAEIHAIFAKEFIVSIKVFSAGVNNPKKLESDELIADQYDEINNSISLGYETSKPDGKYQFDKWLIIENTTINQVNSENVTHTLVRDTDFELYILEVYSLQVTINIPGAGTTSGSGDYAFGSHQNIPFGVTTNTPTVAPAFEFIDWSSTPNVSLPNSQSGSVTIVEDTQIVANYQHKLYTLTVQSEDLTQGTVSKTGGPTYTVFETIDISATPIGTSQFKNWIVVSSQYGNHAGSDFNSTSFTLGAYGNLTLEAQFTYVYTLTIKYYEDGVVDDTREVTMTITEDNPSATVNPYSIGKSGYEFDRWEVESGNVVIPQPTVNNVKTFVVNSDAVIAFHALRANLLTLLVDLPGSATFTHGQGDNFFRETEDINILLSLNNSNPSIPTYKFNNNYTVSDNSLLLTSLNNNSLTNTIRIDGDVTITAHLDYVLYNFSATVDSSIGTIAGTSPNGQYNTLEQIILKAEPLDSSTHIFKEWVEVNGTRTIDGADTTITLANYGHLSIEAVFVKVYSLSITVNYPDIQDEEFVSNHAEGTSATVNVNSLINNGYRFVSWDSNPYVTNSTPTAITMNQDVALVANVERIYVLTLDINIPGAGSLSGAGQYLPSEDAGIETITAVEAGKVEGYVFERWEVISGSIQSGANLNNNSTTVRILEDTLIRAIYSVKEYVIKVTSEPDEGTVGINGGTKSTSVTESFNITETITLQNLAQTTSTHSHQFRRYIVVSADQGLTPGAVFNPGNGFNLSEYGNVELKAEFLKTFTLNIRVYLDGVKSTDTTETLVESSYNSNEANKDVSWPSVTGYVIDRAVKGSGNTFDVNNYNDQNITITRNSYIYFYLDTAEVLTLTIRKRVDGGSPTTIQTLTYDEINNTATVPTITIPSDEEFISWEITAGTTPTSFSNLSKSAWPTSSQFDMVDNVILTYDVGNLYTLDIQLYIPGEDYDNPTWGTPVGEGSYRYGSKVNFGINLNFGYEFVKWIKVTWPQDQQEINIYANFQDLILEGDTVIRAELARIAFPIDGESTVLPPSIYSRTNYGSELDRNMLAMSKNGENVVVSTVLQNNYFWDPEKTEYENQVLNEYLFAGSPFGVPAMRTFTRKNNGEVVESIIPHNHMRNTNDSTFQHIQYLYGSYVQSPLLMDPSGLKSASHLNHYRTIPEKVYISKLTSNGKYKVALSPDNSKFLYGANNIVESSQLIPLMAGSHVRSFTEYGDINFGTESNITTWKSWWDGSEHPTVGKLEISGSTKTVVDYPGVSELNYQHSRASSHCFMGYSVSMSKNFIAYSAPSSIGETKPNGSALGGPGSTYVPGYGIQPNTTNPATIYQSSSFHYNDGNIVYLIPNNLNLDNTRQEASMAGLPKPTYEVYTEHWEHNQDTLKGAIMFNFGGEQPNSNGEDVFSQFGRSIDVSRDSPSFEQSSITNPIFIAITSVWHVCGDVDVDYSTEQMDGSFGPSNSANSTFDRSISSTRVVGVYKTSSGSVAQMSMGAWDPADPDPIKVLTQAHHVYNYWATYNNCNLVIDREDLVDYGGYVYRYKATNSSYGQKVRLSSSAHIAVVSNSRENTKDLPISGTDTMQGHEYKPAEVKIFSRKTITIDRSNVGGDSFNWFEYKHVQSINIPSDHIITAFGQYVFGYDIALAGDSEPFLAISAPTEKTVFIYKWSTANDEFEYWNKISFSECDFFGKAVEFDTRESGDPTKICISADESFFVLDIPDKI